MKRGMAVDPLPSVPRDRAHRAPPGPPAASQNGGLASVCSSLGRQLGLREASLRAGAVVPFGLGSSVAAVAASHGGYFPTSWGWTALALLAVAAVALVT